MLISPLKVSLKYLPTPIPSMSELPKSLLVISATLSTTFMAVEIPASLEFDEPSLIEKKLSPISAETSEEHNMKVNNIINFFIFTSF
jgi:hypothetical protein